MRGRCSWRAGIRVAAVAAVLTVAAAAVTGPSWSQTQTGAGSADDLRYRLSVIDAELMEIRAQLGVAPPARGTVRGTAGSAAAASGDALLRLDRLEAEIRRLTGMIEKIGFEQRQVADDAARRFGDIEFRLTELEGGDISAIPPVQPLGGPDGGGSAAGPQVSISERGDLDRAIEDINNGRFDQGEDRLRRFLTAYPGSPLEAKALYWLGESQFVRGAFQNAARSYLNGYNADRFGLSAPRNLYRLGVTLGRLGQLNEACLTLREVSNQFLAGPADILEAARAESSNLNCG